MKFLFRNIFINFEKIISKFLNLCKSLRDFSLKKLKRVFLMCLSEYLYFPSQNFFCSHTIVFNGFIKWWKAVRVAKLFSYLSFNVLFMMFNYMIYQILYLVLGLVSFSFLPGSGKFLTKSFLLCYYLIFSYN